MENYGYGWKIMDMDNYGWIIMDMDNYGWIIMDIWIIMIQFMVHA